MGPVAAVEGSMACGFASLLLKHRLVQLQPTGGALMGSVPFCSYPGQLSQQEEGIGERVL